MVKTKSIGNPLTYSTSIEGRWRRMIIRGIELGTGCGRINRLYNQRDEWLSNYPDLYSAALDKLRIRVNVLNRPNLEIRQDRPLVIVANHPFGIIDGMILCQLAAQLRPDFRILINAAFDQVDAIRDNSLPIDFRETKEAVQTNLRSRKLALETLRQGGVVVVFPSGGVATRKGLFGQLDEAPWKNFAAKLIRSSEADVLPVLFHGENSRLFHIVSQFSQTLRLSLLIREAKCKIGAEIPMTIGEPIHYEDLEAFHNKDDLISHLREQTFALANVAAPPLKRPKAS